MSLLQRVTSLEGFDREPQAQDIGYGSVRSVKRVISYDAFPPPEESQSAHPKGGIVAYKVSTAQRFAQVIATVLACWLASGILFGFAALKPILVDEGVYREYCTPQEIKDNVEVCYEQDMRLNLFFAVASTTSNVSALPLGTLLDRYGPRAVSVLGAFCIAVGTLLMAEAFAVAEFDGYIAGNVFIALGGTAIFLPSFSIANAFPMYTGLIVSLVTGSYDASAAVFLFYNLVYQATNGRFTPSLFFRIYLAVPVLILLMQVFLMQPDGYKTLPELEQTLERQEDATRDVHSSDDELSDNEVRRLRGRRQDRRESKLRELESLLGDASERHHREEREEERYKKSGVWGALHGQTALQQMKTPWFVLLVLLTVLQMLRMNFFIATIRSQYEYMFESKRLAKQINSFFDIALPVGGVAATPFIGIMLDSISTANLLAVLVAMITAVGVLGSLPYIWAGYANVVVFVLLRPLYYSAMSDYATKVFGFTTFGRIYGTIICLSGVVNLLQPAIDAMTYEVFHSDPTPVNVALAVPAFVFGVALVIYVSWQGRRMSRERQQLDEMRERDHLIREEEEESNYGSVF
ncbi:MFS general substrate transporter [Polychaeton citri CBS 116435]|uniref:MFS general substrate transporter n=1 Tax=Polychaeton citri CBS 116435 TaxID=1314669 RepID=A0A9P4Q1T8_9PEZI|nr:MFS general substrate transporter [Polychaeton citri CBS 116435]